VIARADIVERVRQWSLPENVVEKDYILGWLLWGIASDATLGEPWVFKGGTCLKKCYVETYRFSEDLDFTVLPGGPYKPEDVEPLLRRVLTRVGDASGVDFNAQAPALRLRPDGLSTEGRVYYRGPLGAPTARVKLDISANETVVRPPVLREIAHPYPDGALDASVRCYAFDELFAEKLRAMRQRCRPRDLYDVVNLFWRNDLRLYPDAIRSALEEKCKAKNVPVPVAADFIGTPAIDELASEWENMLGHQLPALPPLQLFLDALPDLFAWLDGNLVTAELPPIAYSADEDDAWSPPPTVAVWGQVPLEPVRFAAANHLLVSLAYGGEQRLIEPYSLRRSRAGALLLHAERADNDGHRTYRVDRIEGVRVTTRPFRPRHPIEFSARGPLHAPLQTRGPSGYARPPRGNTRSPSRRHSGRTYTYQCLQCGREFDHSHPNATLRAHKDPYGYPCRGRRGTLVDQSWY
jgi:predicted nucleotidyltransferase component of viral defense system